MKSITYSAVVLIIFLLLSNTAFGQSNSTLDQIKTKMGLKTQPNWIDLNGDGICDNFGTEKQGTGKGLRGGNGTGVCDGTGRGYGDGSGIRPQDGTGFGKGRRGGNCTGTGVCDFTGPKGNGKRGNK